MHYAIFARKDKTAVRALNGTVRALDSAQCSAVQCSAVQCTVQCSNGATMNSRLG